MLAAISSGGIPSGTSNFLHCTMNLWILYTYYVDNCMKKEGALVLSLLAKAFIGALNSWPPTCKFSVIAIAYVIEALKNTFLF